MLRISIRRILSWIELIFPISLGSFLSLLAIFGYFQNMNENIFLIKYGDMHVLSMFYFVLFITYFFANEHNARMGFYIPITTYAIHELWFFAIAFFYKYVSYTRMLIGISSLVLIITACFFISSLDFDFKINWLIVIFNVIGFTYLIWLSLGFSSSVGNFGYYFHTQYYNDLKTNTLEIFSWLFPLTLLILLSKFFSSLKLGPSG